MKALINLMAIMLLVVFACRPSPDTLIEADEESMTPDSSIFTVVTARITVQPEYVEDFLAAAEPLIDSSRMEPGVISYELFQDPYEEHRFIMVEEWFNQSALDQHNTMSYFARFSATTNEWLAAPVELKIMDVMVSAEE